jgi:hypothetical protein
MITPATLNVTTIRARRERGTASDAVTMTS